MSEQQQFLETVKVVDGAFIHPGIHLERMKQTMKEVFATSVEETLFQELVIPGPMRQGVVKCRILYGSSVDEVDFQPYAPRRISSLKMVDGSGVGYSRKYADRSALAGLLQEKGECDDVLIVQNGRITDTSYSNVVLSDGSGYYTPASYLLNGTCRQRLIMEGKVTPIEITVSDLACFEKLFLINAMLGLEDDVMVPISNVFR